MREEVFALGLALGKCKNKRMSIKSILVNKWYFSHESLKSNLNKKSLCLRH